MKLLEKDGFKMGIRPDGIVYVFIEHEAIVNRRMQDELISTLNELKGGDTRKLPAVVELGDFISVMSDNPMNKFAEFNELLLCIVICADNAGHRMLAKLYNSSFQPLQDYVIVPNFDQGVEYALQRMKDEGIVY